MLDQTTTGTGTGTDERRFPAVAAIATATSTSPDGAAVSAVTGIAPPASAVPSATHLAPKVVGGSSSVAPSDTTATSSTTAATTVPVPGATPVPPIEAVGPVAPTTGAQTPPDSHAPCATTDAVIDADPQRTADGVRDVATNGHMEAKGRAGGSDRDTSHAAATTSAVAHAPAHSRNRRRRDPGPGSRRHRGPRILRTSPPCPCLPPLRPPPSRRADPVARGRRSASRDSVAGEERSCPPSSTGPSRRRSAAHGRGCRRTTRLASCAERTRWSPAPTEGPRAYRRKTPRRTVSVSVTPSPALRLFCANSRACT